MKLNQPRIPLGPLGSFVSPRAASLNRVQSVGPGQLNALPPTAQPPGRHTSCTFLFRACGGGGVRLTAEVRLRHGVRLVA